MVLGQGRCSLGLGADGVTVVMGRDVLCLLEMCGDGGERIINYAVTQEVMIGMM